MTLQQAFGLAADKYHSLKVHLHLGERQMGIYQGLSEYKPDAQASASNLAYTRLRFGLVLVRNYLPLALMDHLSLMATAKSVRSTGIEAHHASNSGKEDTSQIDKG